MIMRTKKTVGGVRAENHNTVTGIVFALHANAPLYNRCGVTYDFSLQFYSSLLESQLRQSLVFQEDLSLIDGNSKFARH